MGYPKKLLLADEQVISQVHPHWKALFVPVLLLLALGSATGAGLWWMPDGKWQLAGRIALGVIAFGALAAWVFRPILIWATTHYVLTDRRLITRKGIIARSGRDMPLTRINDVSFEHTVFERMLGCGTLIVESAGERGQIVLTDIPHVERLQRKIYEQSSLAEQDLADGPDDLQSSPGTSAAQTTDSLRRGQLPASTDAVRGQDPTHEVLLNDPPE